MSSLNKKVETDSKTSTIISCQEGKHLQMSSVCNNASIKEETLPVMVDTPKILTETNSHCREGQLPARVSNLNVRVFVIDQEGRRLLPTKPRRAKQLLAQGKAKVYSVIPFTIQLTYEVKNPVGSFTVGIDDGGKMVGIAVVNEFKNEVIFGGEIKLRQDVKRKMTQRRTYRRNRRYRIIRYRENRFKNRGHKGWLPPTIIQKKDSIIRVIEDLLKRLNITNCTVEQGSFDLQSELAGKKLEGIEYQHSEYEGRNWRAKVLWRDAYKCQHCDTKDNLKAHHIIPRREGGSNRAENGLTLCLACHESLHRGEWQFKKKVKSFRYPAYLQIGKHYLFNELIKLNLNSIVCFGWMTSEWRKNINLIKSHITDAISMVCRHIQPLMNFKEYLIIPKRKKIWDNNPSKTCEEKNGFRHWDIVKATHNIRGVVVGSIGSLKKKEITIRTNFNNNFPVSYNKSRLLCRLNNIIYI